MPKPNSLKRKLHEPYVEQDSVSGRVCFRALCECGWKSPLWVNQADAIIDRNNHRKFKPAIPRDSEATNA